jgi:hypothetical protein
MKALKTGILVALVSLGLAGDGSSQGGGAPKTTVQELEALKADNTALLERQAALLLKLEEMRKQATQIRILTKRS